MTADGRTNEDPPTDGGGSAPVSELGLVFAAVMFYSRLRVPAWTPYSDDVLNRSRKYFPLVGILIGLIAAILFIAAEALVGAPLGIALSMVGTILATGAFHEDGFADTCDGLGGGMEIADKLRIMKDSRIGTYGAAGLIGMLGVKFVALHSLTTGDAGVLVVAAILVFAHTLSRQLASHVVDVSTYVQDPEKSKVKPIASGRLSTPDRAVAWVFVLIAAVPVLIVAPRALATVVVAGLVAGWFRRRVERSIGGYTGDTLGATQQLAEVATYICAVALLP